MCKSNDRQPGEQHHGCGCSQHERGERSRGAHPGVDLIFPEVPAPDPSIYQQAGEALLRRLVRRHHERLAVSPVGHLIDTTPQRFDSMVEKIADFIIEKCGGEPGYTQANGHVCMRVRHFPITIDERARDIWLGELLHALVEVEFPASLMEAYWSWVEPLSVRMINRRTCRAQPDHYPFAQVSPFLQERGAIPNPVYAAQGREESECRVI